MKSRFRVLLIGFVLVLPILVSCSSAAVEESTTEIETVTIVKEAEAVPEEPAAEVSIEEPAPSPTLAPQPTTLPVSPSPAPTLSFLTPTPIIEPRVVEIEWPESLHLGDSDVVRMALIPTRGGYTITTEFPEHQTITQDLPVVRPQGYDLFGVGRLNGVGFTIAPTVDQVRSLPLDDSVVWHWSLTPKQPGRQRITATLLLRWVPIVSSNGTVREAVAYSKGLDIQVRSFFGLTRGQAMITGFFGTLFGGGLSLFAVAYRPTTRDRRVKGSAAIQTRKPNPRLVIEYPSGMHLSTNTCSLLKCLFSRYARLVIQSEFLSGYSGARTFLLLPIRPDGRSDAYTIAKIGERTAIQREYQNYQAFVKHTLPPVTARIQNPPVTTPAHRKPRRNGQAAIQYTFISEFGSQPVSLRQALLENPDPSLLTRLFETFGPNWWMQRTPHTFRLAQEYDRVLPPHYVIEPAIGMPSRSRRIISGRNTPGVDQLNIGDHVTLRNFPVLVPQSDGQITSIIGETLPGHPRLKIRWLGDIPPKRITGRVVAYRDDLLKSYVSGFDLYGLPDPLDKLPHLLDDTIVGSRSIIHGDLNLENILVGPGGIVWLIDFATTREGHPMADFAHLEAEIIAHVIAPQVSPGEYHHMLDVQSHQKTRIPTGLLPDIEALMALRCTVTDIALKCLSNPSQPREYHLALYMSCLGALKFRNLGPHQKHLLYLTAASLSARI